MQLGSGILMMAMGLFVLAVYRANREVFYLWASGFNVGCGFMLALTYYIRAALG